MMVRLKQVLAIVLTWGILMVTSPANSEAWASVAIHPPVFAVQEAAQAALSASQIDELVSPIALYPDALVAQILAASTYPDQVVAANSWLQANSSLNDAQRAEQVNGQAWDPSVKALTQFPSVLNNMATNLSWTSALGDAFYNQQADVMASVQRLRAQAKAAGNLKTTPQQTVTTETQSGQQVIVIQPANPQVVYVPTYNPTVVYGTPYYPPGYSTSALVATSIISFGAGLAIGAAINNSWGWNSWGCGWHGGTVVYNRNVYVSNSNVYRNGGYYGNRPRPTPYGGGTYNRSGNRNTNVSGNTVNINKGGNKNNVNTGNINAGNRNNNVNSGNRPNAGNNNNRPVAGNNNNRPNAGNNANRQNAGNRPPAADRGYGQKPATGTKTGAFSGYSAGGQTRAESSRGKQSYGGGGGAKRSAPAQRSGGGGGGGRKR
jgi:hypothetical protein